MSTRRGWKFPGDFSLSLVLFSIFLSLAVGQTFVGRKALNDDLAQHQRPPVGYAAYLRTGICWESLAENWESEFLEMGAFVWLTSIFTQRGSPESHAPEEAGKPQRDPLTAKSPWAARRGGWIRAVYARSLSLGFLLLFFGAVVIHAVAGASEHNRVQMLHGEPAVSTMAFVGSAEFWFQSLQNWQSEFLGILAMVLLSVWLRQEGSPESKPVNAPHAAQE